MQSALGMKLEPAVKSGEVASVPQTEALPGAKAEGNPEEIFLPDTDMDQLVLDYLSKYGLSSRSPSLSSAINKILINQTAGKFYPRNDKCQQHSTCICRVLHHQRGGGQDRA